MRRTLRLIPIIAVAVALLIPATALAKPGKGPKPKPSPPPAEETITVSGTVTSLKTNLAGDVDGFYLEAGTTWEVRFPPDQWQFIQSEAGAAVTESATVTGIKRTDREGRTHISARHVCAADCYTISSLKASPPAPPPPGEKPAPPPRPDACEPVLLIDDGTVTSLKYAPKGELDGFFADGSKVRFPPHEGLNMQSWLEVGDVVDVEGCLHSGPKGDSRIDATSVADDDGNSEEIERP